MLILSWAHDGPKGKAPSIPSGGIPTQRKGVWIYLVPPKALIRAPEARWSKLCLLMTLDS